MLNQDIARSNSHDLLQKAGITSLSDKDSGRYMVNVLLDKNTQSFVKNGLRIPNLYPILREMRATKPNVLPVIQMIQLEGRPEMKAFVTYYEKSDIPISEAVSWITKTAKLNNFFDNMQVMADDLFGGICGIMASELLRSMFPDDFVDTPPLSAKTCGALAALFNKVDVLVVLGIFSESGTMSFSGLAEAVLTDDSLTQTL